MPYYDVATRSAVVALKSAGGCTTEEVSAKLGISTSQVNRIYASAIKRGFDPQNKPLKIENAFVETKSKSGRPTKLTDDVRDALLETLGNLDGRSSSCADMSDYLSSSWNIQINKATIARCLKKMGYRKVKPTLKPGLTKEMRAARRQFAEAHKDWTLEDWKRVIWTDETAVMLRPWKGSYRIWRRPDERYEPSVIRRRYKKAMSFMFWGSFSYDKKGPCFCWGKESAAEKKAAKKEIDAWNEQLEPVCKEDWEITNGIRRLALRNLPGRRPTWRWTRKTGKLVRDSKGGIDWYRYRSNIILPRLIPFAQACKSDRPETLVMEDNAPCHAHHWNRAIWPTYDLSCLLWPGNSPDLNPIEPVWRWMKNHIRQNDRPTTKKEALLVWEKAWREMPQEVMQQFVERMPHHIQWVLSLKGGNEYHEGAEFQERATNGGENRDQDNEESENGGNEEGTENDESELDWIDE